MKFDDVKVGDQVIIPRGNHGTLATVEKVTKTQFTAGGVRFMKADGAEYGTRLDVWSLHSPWARQATPEAIAALEILNAYDKSFDCAARLAKIVQTRQHNLNRRTRATEQHQQATELLNQISPLLQQVADILKDYAE